MAYLQVAARAALAQRVGQNTHTLIVARGRPLHPQQRTTFANAATLAFRSASAIAFAVGSRRPLTIHAALATIVVRGEVDPGR